MINLPSILHVILAINAVLALAYAAELLIIKLPKTDYTKPLNKAKSIIAFCFVLTGFIFIDTLCHYDVKDFVTYTIVMMLTVTAFSAATLSYTLSSLIDKSTFTDKSFFTILIIVTVLAILSARAILDGRSTWRTVIIIIYVFWYIGQCIYHVVNFRNVYNRAMLELDNYYEDDQRYKLNWIKYCYVIMMLAESFVVVYIVAIPFSAFFIYAAWYGVFMLYFTTNFVSFLGSHELVMDAVIHKQLQSTGDKVIHTIASGRKHSEENAANVPSETAQANNLEMPAIDKRYINREMRKLSSALDKWVADKKYREMDATRKDIANELGTTKEFLATYFSKRIGRDFRSWRTELRIEDAKKMLLEDKKLSINIIAERCGFSDRSNFHRQFSSIVGCSPKSYRESNGSVANADSQTVQEQ